MKWWWWWWWWLLSSKKVNQLNFPSNRSHGRFYFIFTYGTSPLQYLIRKKTLLYFIVFKGPLSVSDPCYITLGLKMNELLDYKLFEISLSVHFWVIHTLFSCPFIFNLPANNLTLIEFTQLLGYIRGTYIQSHSPTRAMWTWK